MPMVHGPIIWVNESNDEKLFRELFSRYNKALVYFARQWVSVPDAEEITADSFTKLWQLRHRFTHSQKAVSFLYISTRNACIDLARKQRTALRRLQDIPPDLQPLPDRDAMDRAEVEAAVLQQLYENIMGMKDKRKLIGLLAFKEGWSNEDISRLLGVSPQAVANLKSKILKELRRLLGLLFFFLK